MFYLFVYNWEVFLINTSQNTGTYQNLRSHSCNKVGIMHFVTDKSQSSSPAVYMISLTPLCISWRMGGTQYIMVNWTSSNTLEGKKKPASISFHHFKEFLLRQVMNNFWVCLESSGWESAWNLILQRLWIRMICFPACSLWGKAFENFQPCLNIHTYYFEKLPV